MTMNGDVIGWIRLHRKLSGKSFYRKDSEKIHLWIHLLFCANRKEREEQLGGKPITCKPGQFTTGRKQLSMETGISESKIERILTYFEKIEQQIEQQKTSVNRLISICNWSEYQTSEQQIEQQVNNDRTTSEQRVNTLQEDKEDKEKKKERNIIPPTLEMVSNYCKERTNKIDPAYFISWNEARGWMMGKNKMKDWQAAIRTWEQRDNQHQKINNYEFTDNDCK